MVKRLHAVGFISLMAVTLLLVAACWGSVPSAMADSSTQEAQSNTSQVGKIDYSRYLQTVYSSGQGLTSGESNDITTTPDGIIWIGTYAGLYRYSGNQFQYMNNYDTIKNANCLFVDQGGRLWVGTNDDGLSVVVDEQVVATINEDQGLPSNSVRSIRQATDGSYYVGTSSSLAVVSYGEDGLTLQKAYKEIAYASDLAADGAGRVAAVTAAGGLYLLDGRNILESLQKAEGSASFTSCVFDAQGLLYVGTDKGDVLRYQVGQAGLTLDATISTNGLSNINSLTQVANGDIFLCSDNGAGWIDPDGEVHLLNSGSFNNSIDRMTQDYQGNLWFSSSRLGVLHLSDSAFAEIYPEAGLESAVVNAIAGWNDRLYFGTDSGLDVVDAQTHAPVEDALSRQLGTARIRCLRVDSQNRLWVCAYGVGLVCALPDGTTEIYGDQQGKSSAKYRSVIEMSDGTIAASSDQGVSFVKDGALVKSITKEDGLSNSLVLCLLEVSDGILLAGTDGGGIAVIQDGKIVRTVSRQDGLGSGVILRMVQNVGTQDVFIVTSNGLCYWSQNGAIRELDQFPYSNNYDLFDPGDGTVYVTSSAGIFVMKKQDLVDNNLAEYDTLNYLSGLRGVFTANAWSYVDQSGNWFLAGNTGVTQFEYVVYAARGQTQYRMQVRQMRYDGVTQSLIGQDKVTLSPGVESVEISPEVINYSVTEPYVAYYLEGAGSQERTVLLQSELETITYPTPNPGVYRFHLQILDSRNGTVVDEKVYTITKEYALYDYLWFKILAVLVAFAAVAWLTWFLTQKAAARALALQRRETELAKKQVAMGNETILAIAHAVDAKDSRTSHHSARVSEYAVMIARRMNYGEDDLENLRKTALLHDIGKIGIPDAVLNKPGKLTDEEYQIMKSHVTVGGEILKDFTLLPHVQEGALYHHERYDGRGYGSGLKGEDIPETARIIGVADAFDAMTADRVYRPRLDFEIVLSEMKKGRGTQFDPKIVDILLDLIDEGEITQDGPRKPESKAE